MPDAGGGCTCSACFWASLSILSCWKERKKRQTHQRHRAQADNSAVVNAVTGEPQRKQEASRTRHADANERPLTLRRTLHAASLPCWQPAAGLLTSELTPGVQRNENKLPREADRWRNSK